MHQRATLMMQMRCAGAPRVLASPEKMRPGESGEHQQGGTHGNVGTSKERLQRKAITHAALRLVTSMLTVSGGLRWSSGQTNSFLPLV